MRIRYAVSKPVREHLFLVITRYIQSKWKAFAGLLWWLCVWTTFRRHRGSHFLKLRFDFVQGQASFGCHQNLTLTTVARYVYLKVILKGKYIIFDNILIVYCLCNIIIMLWDVLAWFGLDMNRWDRRGKTIWRGIYSIYRTYSIYNYFVLPQLPAIRDHIAKNEMSFSLFISIKNHI